MSPSLEGYEVLVAGSPDFIRRMTAAVRQRESYGRNGKLVVSSVNLTEARASIFGERPHIFVFDIGLKTTRRDLVWIRTLLNQVRDRFGKSIYIIAAITSPERFVFGGDLIFQDNATLQPSGLIDNLIISPPPGIPSILTLEEQLRDCLTYVVDCLPLGDTERTLLPALWEDGWVPVMCDPESRNVWMRWLPRYARYVNENPIIVGPTGSGKTRLAAAIHKLSGRPGPFVSITPRDFSSTELVQAELFGAVVGAYTGAVDKWGLVKKAERGTLFIDELQSIDRDLQGKLITFIENKSYRRVGEAESNTADVRFVFATNRSLQELVESGALRDDFAYRLERLQIQLVALDERRLDIAAGICFSLAKVLRERAASRGPSSRGGSASSHSPALSSSLEGLSPGAYELLFCASWPGNLRQLENTIAKLIELADIKNIRLIDRESVGETMKSLLGHTAVTATDLFERALLHVALRARSDGYPSLSDCLMDVADRTRTEALEVTGGDTRRAAELIHDSVKAMNFFAASRSGAFG